MYFFVPNCEKEFVQKEEAEHFWACRVQVGKTYKICDQNGTLGTIQILNLDKKTTKIDFKILEKTHISFENWLKINNKSPKNLFQAQIDRNYLEKWAEVLPFGFWQRVFLFQSEFSPKQNVNLERLNRILTRSCEQSETLYKPQITVIDKKKLFEIIQNTQNQNKIQILDKGNLTDNSTDFNGNFESQIDRSDESFENIGLEKVKKTTQNSVYDQKDQKKEIVSENFVIGAEGGFSDQEKEFFATFGCQFKTFGGIIYPSWLATFLTFLVN